MCWRYRARDAAGLTAALRLAAILLACAALAACDNLPQPFKPAEKTTSVWDESGVGLWGSVAVRPIAGLPAPQSATITDRIVETLKAQDVPASARAASSGSIALAGRVRRVSGTLHWTLIAPGGEAVRRFVEPQPAGSWDDATEAELAAIAARAARRVAAALEPPTLAVPGAPRLAPVVLDSVRGAPGDGGPALARAMRHALARAGIAVAGAPDEETLAIRGRVLVAPSGADDDDALVTIAWTVLAPDGAEVGTVTQSNRERASRLAGAWGALAETVAGAGAPGIAQLLRHAGAAGIARARPREAPAVTAAEPVAPAVAAAPAAPAATVAAPAAPAVRATVSAPIAPATAVGKRAALAATVAAPIALATAAGGRIVLAAKVEAPIALAVSVAQRIAPATPLEAPIALPVTVR